MENRWGMNLEEDEDMGTGKVMSFSRELCELKDSKRQISMRKKRNTPLRKNVGGYFRYIILYL